MGKRKTDAQSGNLTPAERARGRVVVDARRTRGPMAAPLVTAINAALCAAERDGYTRSMVAQRLSISPRTLAGYVELEGNRIHADTLIRMLRDEQILGPDARAMLLDDVLALCGVERVVVDTQGDGEPALTQYLQGAQWMGEVASRLSAAGGEIDAAERKSIRAAIAETQRELAELERSLGGRK